MPGCGYILLCSDFLPDFKYIIYLLVFPKCTILHLSDQLITGKGPKDYFVQNLLFVSSKIETPYFTLFSQICYYFTLLD